MPRIRLHSLDDPRLEPYQRMKDRQLAREGNRFIAESQRVVERLLASDFPVDSVLVTDRRVEAVAPQVPESVPLYVVEEAEMTSLAGFAIHTGVLAVGRKKASPTLDALLPTDRPATLVICPEVKEQGNLGALCRVSAAFGVDGLILGPHCCDPFYRRALRVAMGTTFRVPIRRSDALLADLRVLRASHGVHLDAAVLDEGAESLRTVSRPPPPDRLGLVVGHEIEGIASELVQACDRWITLPMHLGTDSLNISVATAVFLYHFLPPDEPVRLPEAAD